MEIHFSHVHKEDFFFKSCVLRTAFEGKKRHKAVSKYLRMDTKTLESTSASPCEVAASGLT